MTSFCSALFQEHACKQSKTAVRNLDSDLSADRSHSNEKTALGRRDSSVENIQVINSGFEIPFDSDCGCIKGFRQDENGNWKRCHCISPDRIGENGVIKNLLTRAAQNTEQKRALDQNGDSTLGTGGKEEEQQRSSLITSSDTGPVLESTTNTGTIQPSSKPRNYSKEDCLKFAAIYAEEKKGTDDEIEDIARFAGWLFKYGQDRKHRTIRKFQAWLKQRSELSVGAPQPKISFASSPAPAESVTEIKAERQILSEQAQVFAFFRKGSKDCPNCCGLGIQPVSAYSNEMKVCECVQEKAVVENESAADIGMVALSSESITAPLSSEDTVNSTESTPNQNAEEGQSNPTEEGGMASKIHLSTNIGSIISNQEMTPIRNAGPTSTAPVQVQAESSSKKPIEFTLY